MPYPQLEVTLKYICKGKRLPIPTLNNDKIAFAVIKNICNKKTILWVEEMLILCLSIDRKLIGWYRVATGGTASVHPDIRVVATIAAKCAATHVILAHNHPSGRLHPSTGDIEATNDIKKGLNTIGIELDDHIIFTDKDYFSMNSAGYIID